MISINATLLVQIVNLLVLLVIMNYVMYRPLRRLVAQRREAIEQGHAEARRQLGEAEALASNYQQALRRGRTGVAERLAVFQREAEEQGKAAIEEAQAKARASAQAMRERVERELAQARQDIAQEAQTVAQAMARQILQRGLS
ncbi:MAG: ATP synthase F0 subunit B [Thermodesulfobacteriota bacterium]